MSRRVRKVDADGNVTWVNPNDPGDAQSADGGGSLEDILAAGRAPGAIVKGDGTHVFNSKTEIIPNHFDPRNSQQIEADDMKAQIAKHKWAREKKEVEKASGTFSRDGAIRPFASTPLRAWMAAEKDMGKGWHKDKENFRRLGTKFEGA